MWLKVCDKMHDHPKVQRLIEDDDGDALMLWLLAGSWCGDQLSDGVVPAFVLRRWDTRWREHADALVRVGLWEPAETDDGRPAFRFVDWLDYNDSRAKVLADREANRMRQAFYRDKPLKAAIDRRDKDRCRYCGTLVIWADKRSDQGGTYDHVKPIIRGGKNTLDNVVVCCRGCNGRKSGLTLAEAGLKLLKPGTLGAPHMTGVTDDDTEHGGVVTGSGRVGSGTKYVLGDTPESPDTTDDPTSDTTEADTTEATGPDETPGVDQ